MFQNFHHFVSHSIKSYARKSHNLDIYFVVQKH
uniref:Uncharacterized protein n=1 Tax=Arundo donax TaxID=35708 RepID=A0A0A8ZAZ7_ARUDO